MPSARVERRLVRLEARMTVRQKALIKRAAEYQGRSVTEFVVSTLASAAEVVIREYEAIHLNEAQSKAFVHAPLKPKAPNTALRRAFATYRRSVESR